VANWESLLNLFQDDAVAADHKIGAFRRPETLRSSSRLPSQPPEDIGVLAALAQDAEPKVRATAAAALALLVAADRGGPVAAKALQRRLHDPGTSVPLSIGCPENCSDA
jgi:hypothetical protein